jgi:hypothetical protein
MKYIIIVFNVLLFPFGILLAQQIYYKSAQKIFEIDYDQSSFSLYRQYPENPQVYLGHPENTATYIYAEGNIKTEADMVLCIDTLENRCVFKLKQLTQFSVQVESSDCMYLVTKDTLYAYSCRYKYFTISNMKFENGLPDGIWSVWISSIGNSIQFDKGKVLKIDNLMP